MVLVITDLSPGQADDVRDLHAPHNQHSQHSQIDLIEVAPVPYEPKAQRLNRWCTASMSVPCGVSNCSGTSGACQLAMFR